MVVLLSKKNLDCSTCPVIVNRVPLRVHSSFPVLSPAASYVGKHLRKVLRGTERHQLTSSSSECYYVSPEDNKLATPIELGKHWKEKNLYHRGFLLTKMTSLDTISIVHDDNGNVNSNRNGSNNNTCSETLNEIGSDPYIGAVLNEEQPSSNFIQSQKIRKVYNRHIDSTIINNPSVSVDKKSGSLNVSRRNVYLVRRQSNSLSQSECYPLEKNERDIPENNHASSVSGVDIKSLFQQLTVEKCIKLPTPSNMSSKTVQLDQVQDNLTIIPRICLRYPCWDNGKIPHLSAVFSGFNDLSTKETTLLNANTRFAFLGVSPYIPESENCRSLDESQSACFQQSLSHSTLPNSSFPAFLNINDSSGLEIKQTELKHKVCINNCSLIFEKRSKKKRVEKILLTQQLHHNSVSDENTAPYFLSNKIIKPMTERSMRKDNKNILCTRSSNTTQEDGLKCNPYLNTCTDTTDLHSFDSSIKPFPLIPKQYDWLLSLPSFTVEPGTNKENLNLFECNDHTYQTTKKKLKKEHVISRSQSCHNSLGRLIDMHDIIKTQSNDMIETHITYRQTQHYQRQHPQLISNSQLKYILLDSIETSQQKNTVHLTDIHTTGLESSERYRSNESALTVSSGEEGTLLESNDLLTMTGIHEVPDMWILKCTTNKSKNKKHDYTFCSRKHYNTKKHILYSHATTPSHTTTSYTNKTMISRLRHFSSFICLSPWLFLTNHYTLSPAEIKAIASLSYISQFSFEECNPAHEILLKRYWTAGLPDSDFNARPNPKWRQLGFQGDNPRTDFRGGGIISLACMVYFATHRKNDFNRIVTESADLDSYPFSAGFINVAFMLIICLQLKPDSRHCCSGDNRIFSKKAIKYFARLLCNKEQHAFEELFCCCCISLHRHWSYLFFEPGNTLMDFQKALQLTKDRLLLLFNSEPRKVSDFQKLYSY